jgi:DNA-directed RNA polymerase subunit H (RpoH/RPB5)
MFRMRRLVAIPEQEWPESLHELNKNVDGAEAFKLLRGPKQRETTLVLFVTGKIGVSSAKEIVQHVTPLRVGTLVFVVFGKITTPAKKEIALSLGAGVAVQTFAESELQSVVPNHALVPKQRRLSPEEAKAFLRRLSVTEKQLPRVRFTDPIAKFYGWRKGDIIHSLRVIGGALQPIDYYRIVWYIVLPAELCLRSLYCASSRAVFALSILCCRFSRAFQPFVYNV